jgi:hypothetical protein
MIRSGYEDPRLARQGRSDERQSRGNVRPARKAKKSKAQPAVPKQKPRLGK